MMSDLNVTSAGSPQRGNLETQVLINNSETGHDVRNEPILQPVLPCRRQTQCREATALLPRLWTLSGRIKQGPSTLNRRS